MAVTLEFELVSPEQLLVSEAVAMVVVPGTEGDFWALPQHAPVLSSVRNGVIEIHGLDKSVRRIFVAGGFAEVTNTRCTVLAEEAVPLDRITRVEAEERYQKAQDALRHVADPDETTDVEKELAIAQALLDFSPIVLL